MSIMKHKEFFYLIPNIIRSGLWQGSGWFGESVFPQPASRFMSSVVRFANNLATPSRSCKPVGLHPGGDHVY
jgi:hypothetical protein